VLVDTHCHLDLDAFDRDRAEMLARARDAGVVACVIPAIRPSTWDVLADMVGRHANDGPLLRIALGVHPQVVPDLTREERDLACDPDALTQRIAELKTRVPVVAVGECGLDGATPHRELQEQIFAAHLAAAKMLDLPALIHVLRAHDTAPRLIRESGARGVLHSYSGGADLVPVYADLGLCFSLAGPVTYDNARRPLEAARAIPADRLLAETDAPDQAPAPHRGGRSEPAMVREVVAALAQARGATFAEVAALTTANATRLFGLSI
jgi:TatD DNase family protein